MHKSFEVIDYIIFAVTLSVSAAISLYFGCFGNKQKHAKEYLFGAGNLSSIPIGLSLLSSAVSALAVIGTVQETYIFGTQFLMCSLGLVSSLLVTWNLILPVFRGNLNLKTPYEYFERRFDTKIRLLLSIMYVLHLSIFCSIILFASTVPFSEATGIELYICTTVIGATCAIYTMMGGFSGVIWTDVLQTILMFASCTFILFKGLSISGGLGVVMYESDRGQRLQLFNFDTNPFTRLTFWSAVLGMCVSNVAHSSCAASGIQRFMALKTEKEAKMSTSIQAIGFALIIILSGMIGLCIYVFYKDCDPIKSKKIENGSKLLTYFINEITENTVGFIGLFTAGLLSAGLSSLSAELNTVAGLIYYDILIFGIVFIIIAPLIEKSKYIYQLSITVASWTYGVKFGVMILATTVPKSNSWGAFSGIIAGFLSIAWISINAMYLDIASSYVLPLSIENCSIIADNVTAIITNLTLNSNSNSDDSFSFYKLSYMYYSIFGVIVTVTVGIIVSYITGVNDVNEMDPRLIIPCLRPGNKSKINLRTIFLDKAKNDNSENET